MSCWVRILTNPPHVGAWMSNEFVMILVKTILLVGGSIPPLPTPIMPEKCYGCTLTLIS